MPQESGKDVKRIKTTKVKRESKVPKVCPDYVLLVGNPSCGKKERNDGN